MRLFGIESDGGLTPYPLSAFDGCSAVTKTTSRSVSQTATASTSEFANL